MFPYRANGTSISQLRKVGQCTLDARNVQSVGGVSRQQIWIIPPPSLTNHPTRWSLLNGPWALDGVGTESVGQSTAMN